jgi:hypothetical protein
MEDQFTVIVYRTNSPRWAEDKVFGFADSYQYFDKVN